MSVSSSFQSEQGLEIQNQEIIDFISTLIDSDDQEEFELYAQIQDHPESSTTTENLVDLLYRILKRNESCKYGSRISELVSYLNGHVALLQAIVQDPKLASLFLIGQHGSQSFTSIQKMTLSEQAARTRKFLADFPPSNITTSLMDFESLYKRTNKLPEKIGELTKLKSNVDGESDPVCLKHAFSEVCSILETALVFNDLLIRCKQPAACDSPPKDSGKLRNENKMLKVEIEGLRDTIASLTGRVNSAERAMDEITEQMKIEEKCQKAKDADLEDLHREKDRLAKSLKSLKETVGAGFDNDELVGQLGSRLKRIERQYKIVKETLSEVALRKKACEKDDDTDELHSEIDTLRKENTLLAEQVKQLQAQISNYQSAIQQKDEKVDRLSDKVKTLAKENAENMKIQSKQQNAITDLQALYKETSEQVDNLTEMKATLSKQLNKSKKQMAALKGDNDELKAMLERANEESKKQMSDNAVLLRQLRRSGTTSVRDEPDDEVAKLKAQLKEARKFIKKLQTEIEEYRNRQPSTCCSFSSRAMDSDSTTSFESIPERTSRTVTQKTRIVRKYTEEECNGDMKFMQPNLDDLDSAIRQLELTIHRSRQESGLSASSD